MNVDYDKEFYLEHDKICNFETGISFEMRMSLFVTASDDANKRKNVQDILDFNSNKFTFFFQNANNKINVQNISKESRKKKAKRCLKQVYLGS